MKIDREDGAALLVTLIMVMILSLLGASLMFSAQSETWSSMNYRLMTQARYGAEAGIHRAANYLLNSYVVPGDPSDPLDVYTLTAAPVKYNGQAVVLSSEPSVTSHYPVPGVVTGFAANAKGSFTPGNSGGGLNSVISYTATAELVGMRQLMPCTGVGTSPCSYGALTSEGVQTWRITGYGSIDGVRNAQIQVETLLERQVMEAFTYAAFATASQCAAMRLVGNAHTDSYDSTSYTGGTPATQPSGGNVGTNGNLTESGNAIINGSVSTPRSGVGNCSTGNMTALTRVGNATVTDGVINLPQVVQFPTPDLPNPLPPTSSYAPPATWIPGTYGNININANVAIHLTAGTYNVNSIAMSGGAQLIIDSGPVIFNVVGTGQTMPVDLNGNGVINATMNPANFQVLYAGTGTVRMTGNANQAALVYAPKAALNLVGNADFYGSMIAGTVYYNGNGTIHYDRRLSSSPYVIVGNPMMGAFSWRKF